MAYVARIGGLMGGALFAFIILKSCLSLNQDVFGEIPEDDIAPLLEKALKHIAELDMESGCQLLRQVVARDPENIDALTHLFNVYKQVCNIKHDIVVTVDLSNSHRHSR